MSKIITEFIYPPIPGRNYDWEAIRSSHVEGDPIGYGAIEEEAIKDLIEKEEELNK